MVFFLFDLADFSLALWWYMANSFLFLRFHFSICCSVDVDVDYSKDANGVCEHLNCIVGEDAQRKSSGPVA